MSKVLAALRKQQSYTIEINGEPVLIRALRQSEMRDAKSIKDDEESFGLVIGFGLLNEDGSQLFARSEGESAADFGRRVLTEADLPTDNRLRLVQEILKLTNNPPNAERALKN